MKQTYWMDGTSEEVALKMCEIHGKWSIWNSHPIVQAWVRNHILYYSTVLEATAWETSLSFEGEQGELVKMIVPQARSMIRQLVSILTKNKLSFNAVAESSAMDVIHAVRLGNAVASNLVADNDLDKQSDSLCELALIHGMSFIETAWRTDKGEKIVGDGHRAYYAGDVEIAVRSVMDVLFDPTIEKWENQPWVEVRKLRNKWDLIAQYPDLKDNILQLSKVAEAATVATNYSYLQDNDDMVWVYELYHRPSPALPEGRIMLYSNEKTVYYDVDNKIGKIPVEEMKPEQVQGTAFGYPQLSNLLPAQEMLDAIISAVSTNESALGVQSVLVPRGANISVQEIQGLNYINFTPTNTPGGGKPEALQLAKSSPDSFKLIELYTGFLSQLSNINGALRGTPPPGVTSGVAIATLATNAIEFLDAIAKSLSLALEKTIYNGIKSIAAYGATERSVPLGARDSQIYMKTYTASDLDPIQQIKITQNNPLMQTMAGRTEIAEKLVQSGLIKTAQDYISVLDGAPLNKLYADELSENDLITTENEVLIEGKKVLALSTDAHPLHIRKHAALLNDPQVRSSNKHVGLILEHILEHVKLEKETDPTLKAMLRTGIAPQGGELPPIPGEASSTSSVMPTNTGADPAESLMGAV